MKEIVWIDKYPEALEIIAENFIKSKEYHIHFFNDQKKAIQHLISNQNSIDLVITNYCTFSWVDPLTGKGSEHAKTYNIKDYLGNLRSHCLRIPIILFSSLLSEETDILTKQYEMSSLPKENSRNLKELVDKLLSDY